MEKFIIKMIVEDQERDQYFTEDDEITVELQDGSFLKGRVVEIDDSYGTIQMACTSLIENVKFDIDEIKFFEK